MKNFACAKERFIDHVEKLIGEGVFSYDQVKGFEHYHEGLLPRKEAFFNRLAGSRVSGDDYEYGIHVFDRLKYKTIGEYSNNYLQSDTLLLAGVINFRRFSP